MKITVTAKKNVLYDGKMYRAGESFQIDETEESKLASWLKEDFPEKVPAADKEVENVENMDDKGIAQEGLPPLDAPPRKGKRNG